MTQMMDRPTATPEPIGPMLTEVAQATNVTIDRKSVV